MKMGNEGIRRNFFEHDKEFDENLKLILDAYEKSAGRTSLLSKHAIKNGELSALRSAQWYEAITSTIEEVLLSLVQGSEFEFPDEPKFDD